MISPSSSRDVPSWPNFRSRSELSFEDLWREGALRFLKLNLTRDPRAQLAATLLSMLVQNRRLVACFALVLVFACRGANAPSDHPRESERAVNYTPNGALAGEGFIDFEIPRGKPSENFFAKPWPSELWKTSNGKLDFSSYP